MDGFGAANNGTNTQSNPFATMNPMMFMMMSGKEGGGNMDSMMEMMLMSQMMGGQNMFNQQPIEQSVQ